MVRHSSRPPAFLKWAVNEANLPGGKHPVVIVEGPNEKGEYRVLRGQTRGHRSGEHVAVVGGLAGERMGLSGPTHFWRQESTLLWISQDAFLFRRGHTPLDYQALLQELMFEIELML